MRLAIVALVVTAASAERPSLMFVKVDDALKVDAAPTFRR